MFVATMLTHVQAAHDSNPDTGIGNPHHDPKNVQFGMLTNVVMQGNAETPADVRRKKWFSLRGSARRAESAPPDGAHPLPLEETPAHGTASELRKRLGFDAPMSWPPPPVNWGGASSARLELEPPRMLDTDDQEGAAGDVAEHDDVESVHAEAASSQTQPGRMQ